MAEPFAKPNKECLKQALKLYSDPLLYWATNAAVEALVRLNPNDFDVSENQFREWIFLTRRLIWKFGLCQVVGNVYRLVEEDAEEYWKDWEAPEIKKDKRDKMLPGDWTSG